MSSSGFNLKQSAEDAMHNACELAFRYRMRLAREIVAMKASTILPASSKLRLIEVETRKLTSSNALALAEAIAISAILEHYVELTS